MKSSVMTEMIVMTQPAMTNYKPNDTVCHLSPLSHLLSHIKHTQIPTAIKNVSEYYIESLKLLK